MNDIVMKALITHVFEPFTLSCVMVIRLHQNKGLGEPMVLKLFDRRFATQCRRDAKAKQWTLESEIQYQKFIETGGASELIADIKENEFYVKGGGNVAADETYLHYLMQKSYKTECEVYNTLKHLEGKRIPRLLCTLEFPAVPGSAPLSIEKHTAIPGIFMQHLDGFTLSNLSVYAPRTDWQAICDLAFDTVNRMTDEGILNVDIKTRNFIVHNDRQCGFKVFMVDFGLCHFRQECSDDDDWWHWKATQDEEGGLAWALGKELKEGFVYQRSA